MKKYNLDVVCVDYTSDEKFAEILGVSLVSLYENSKDMDDDIIIYVLDLVFRTDYWSFLLQNMERFSKETKGL